MVRSLDSVMLALLLVAAMVMPLFAHNWMHTPSRARRAATTVKGCMQRKATDTHAQIGPGQRMSLKWATGHPRRPTYWVIMPGAYEYKLGMPAPDLVKLLDDYLDNRPDGVPNLALQPEHQRPSCDLAQRFHALQLSTAAGSLTRLLRIALLIYDRLPRKQQRGRKRSRMVLPGGRRRDLDARRPVRAPRRDR